MCIAAREAWLLLAATFLMLVDFGESLECVQCDRRGTWYSPEDNERHIARCQNGLIEPTKCTNLSHTHCIFSYYKQGMSSSIIVTERRCGVEEDILGCTLYKSSRKRFKRHFFGGTTSANQLASSSHRRRDADLFVEVCTEGCVGDGCISAADGLVAVPAKALALLLLCVCQQLQRVFFV